MTNLNDEDKNKKESKATKKEEEKELSIEEKLKDTEDKLLRSLAELENQRKRFDKDIKEAILDNLQRAHISIKNDPTLKDNKDLDKFLKNIEIIEKDLISIFKKNKIDKIDTAKKKFDPNFHQAMTEIENDNVEAGTIVQEIQAGYMLGERLLRPSLVAVSKKSVKNEEKNEKKK